MIQATPLQRVWDHTWEKNQNLHPFGPSPRFFTPIEGECTTIRRISSGSYPTFIIHCSRSRWMSPKNLRCFTKWEKVEGSKNALINFIGRFIPLKKESILHLYPDSSWICAEHIAKINKTVRSKAVVFSSKQVWLVKRRYNWANKN